MKTQQRKFMWVLCLLVVYILSIISDQHIHNIHIHLFVYIFSGYMYLFLFFVYSCLKSLCIYNLFGNTLMLSYIKIFNKLSYFIIFILPM